jgi:hypothetical protein
MGSNPICATTAFPEASRFLGVPTTTLLGVLCITAGGTIVSVVIGLWLCGCSRRKSEQPGPAYETKD